MSHSESPLGEHSVVGGGDVAHPPYTPTSLSPCIPLTKVGGKMITAAKFFFREFRGFHEAFATIPPSRLPAPTEQWFLYHIREHYMQHNILFFSSHPSPQNMRISVSSLYFSWRIDEVLGG